MSPEELILRIVAEGFGEAVAAIHETTDAVEEMTAKMDVASASVAGSGSKKGLVGHLASLKTLMLGWGIDKAIKGFASFQSQMERLRTQTGATQGEVTRMTKGILGMATSVGTGPQSLAQALYHVESAGIRGKNALDALRVSAEGAQVGGANLTDTTTSLTAVLVAGFAKGANAVAKMKSAMGQLNATVGAGDMTFQDLNDALSTGILSTFATIGLKVKDLGAGLAVLGDNNIRGAAAATRLRMGLMQLIHPSSTVAAAVGSIHLKTMQLAEDLRKPNGLLTMLKDLKEHLGPLNTKAEKTHAADVLGGIFGGGRNSSAMLTLITQMGRLKSKYDDITKSGHDFNAQWKATTKTLQFTLDQIVALGQVILIKLGGPLSAIVTGLKDFADGLSKGKVWAQAIAGALLGVGAALVYLKLTTIDWGKAWAATQAMMEASPIMLLLTALSVAIVLIGTHWKTVESVTSRIFGEWGKWFSGAWHWVKRVADVVGGALASAFDSVKHVVEDLWHIVQKVFSFIIGKGGTVSKIFSYLNPVGMAGHLFNGAKSVIGDIAGTFATGTDYVPRTGSYLVGERGPEIVNLRQGSQVVPNDQIGGSTGGNGETILEATIVNELDGKVVSRQMVRQSLMATARRGAGNATLTTGFTEGRVLGSRRAEV